MGSETKWVTVLSSELPAVLADTQSDAILASYNATGVLRFNIAASAVVAEIRAAVAKHGRFLSSDETTIPPEAKTRALWLILEQVAPAIGTLALTENQKDAIKVARDWVNALRENESVAESVTMPSDPIGGAATVQQSPKASIVGTVSVRRFTREQTDGLG